MSLVDPRAEITPSRDLELTANNPSTKPYALSRGAVDRWWEFPIPNRQVASFQMGRFANQLNRLFQEILFGGSAETKRKTNEILGRITVLSYKLVDKPPNRLLDVIDGLCESWEEHLYCEAAQEDVVACFSDRFATFELETPEERCKAAVESWVYPLIADMLERVRREFSEKEAWAFELGQRVDQAIRRSDFYRFVDLRLHLEKGWYRNTQVSRAPDFCIAGWVCQPIKPKARVPRVVWPDCIKGLLERLGIPRTEYETVFPASFPDDLEEHSASMLNSLEALDRIVRDHFSTDDEEWSRHLTMKEAAKLYNEGEGASNPTTFIKRLIHRGKITAPRGSGQRRQFVIREFPLSARAKMKSSFGQDVSVPPTTTSL